MNQELLDELRQVAPLRLNEPLSHHTTLGVGGPADLFLAADTEGPVRAAFALARSHGLPVFILGAGSNILIGDGGIRGLVIENRAGQVEGPSANGAGVKVRGGGGGRLAPPA